MNTNPHKRIHPAYFLAFVLLGLFGIIVAAGMFVWERPEQLVRAVSLGSSFALGFGVLALFLRSYRIIRDRKSNKMRHWLVLLLFPYAAIFYYPFQEDFDDACI